MYEVSLTACVEGNPFKAWHGSEGPDDEVNVPNDVWEDQTYEFDSLDEAKDFIRDLHPQVTTHVELSVGGEVIYRKDAGDDLDAAEEGVVPDSTLATLPDEPVKIPEAPPLMASKQGA